MPRIRRPVESRLLDGTYEPGRHGPLPDPNESVAPPVRPDDLNAAEKKFWDEFLRLLPGVIRERDGPQLAEMCRFKFLLSRIHAELRKLKPGAKGFNQLLVASGIAFDKFDKIASRFGLTPSDRAKLRAEMVGPVKPKVATRKPTKLDKQGGPNGRS